MPGGSPYLGDGTAVPSCSAFAVLNQSERTESIDSGTITPTDLPLAASDSANSTGELVRMASSHAHARLCPRRITLNEQPNVERCSGKMGGHGEIDTTRGRKVPNAKALLRRRGAELAGNAGGFSIARASTERTLPSSPSISRPPIVQPAGVVTSSRRAAGCRPDV